MTDEFEVCLLTYAFSVLSVSWCLTFHSKHSCVVPMALDIPAIRKFLETFVMLVHFHRSDNAIYDFSKKAVENGLDIFRVFDSLNYFGK